MNRILKAALEPQSTPAPSENMTGPVYSNVGMAGKTKATQEAYLKRGRQLWNRAEQHHKESRFYFQFEPHDFLQWLEGLLPNLRPSSRRQYIAAARAILHDMRRNPAMVRCYTTLNYAIEIAMSMHAFHYAQPGERQKKPHRTSSGKAKRLNLVEIAKFTDQYQAMDHKWLRAAILWLTANTIVGLRPVEWRTVAMETVNGVPYLLVRNAKHTNGRSFGCSRRLDLSGLSRQCRNASKSDPGCALNIDPPLVSHSTT